jgi:hypothetical protein
MREKIMIDAPHDSGSEAGEPKTKGIGFGVFLLVAGAALLAQQAGWVSPKMDWLFPVILIAWGVSELYQRLK